VERTLRDAVGGDVEHVGEAIGAHVERDEELLAEHLPGWIGRMLFLGLLVMD
jgi:hypothetical protein